MLCPYCQARLRETDPECANCSISLEKADALLGAVPRLVGGLSDGAKLIGRSDSRRILKQLRETHILFPQVEVSVVTLDGIPPGVNLHTITYDGYPPENRTYVAAGDNGVILTSPDGRTWSSVDTGLDLTGVPTESWNRAYENIIGRGLVSSRDCAYGKSGYRPSPPLTFGSHLSRLAARIREEPCKAKITRAEFVRIATWIDANTPYYGTYRGKRDLKDKDDPDFRPTPLAASE